jgi:hypothetical protein
LPGSAFTGQAFHRVAQQVSDEQLEQAQVTIANAAVARFGLSADVLAFDTTNFDTHALAEIRVTLVRTKTGTTGRRPTATLAPELTAEQRRAVKVFELQRWAPKLFHV